MTDHTYLTPEERGKLKTSAHPAIERLLSDLEHLEAEAKSARAVAQAATKLYHDEVQRAEKLEAQLRATKRYEEMRDA